MMMMMMIIIINYSFIYINNNNNSNIINKKNSNSSGGVDDDDNDVILLLCNKVITRDVNAGYLDTRVPCGLPGSRETSDLPSYRDRLHQSTDCPCGHIQTSTALVAAENAERPVC